MVLALACGCSKEKTLKSPESETETGTKAGSVKQSTSKHKNQPTKDAKKRDESVMQKTNTEEAELVGEVIDAWCYCSKVMGDGRGKEHEKCAKLCVAGGVSAGILTDDGTVYIAAKHQGYKGANGILLPYVAKRVRVKGWIAERGGCKVVKVREVELVEAENESKENGTEKKVEDSSNKAEETGKDPSEILMEHVSEDFLYE